MWVVFGGSEVLVTRLVIPRGLTPRNSKAKNQPHSLMCSPGVKKRREPFLTPAFPLFKSSVPRDVTRVSAAGVGPTSVVPGVINPAPPRIIETARRAEVQSYPAYVPRTIKVCVAVVIEGSDAPSGPGQRSCQKCSGEKRGDIPSLKGSDYSIADNPRVARTGADNGCKVALILYGRAECPWGGFNNGDLSYKVVVGISSDS